jgi:hypothetical protein
MVDSSSAACDTVEAERGPTAAHGATRRYTARLAVSGGRRVEAHRPVPLGGFTSRSNVEQIADEIGADDDGRPALILYAGDFDASGMGIDRGLR